MDDQVTRLSAQLKEFTDSTRAEYGATQEALKALEGKLDGDLSEMKDRLKQAADALAKQDEVTAVVLELQKANQERERQFKVLPEFNTQILKNADVYTVEECAKSCESFLTTPSKDTDIQRLHELHDHLLFLKAYCEPRGASWTLDDMHKAGRFGSWHPAESKSLEVRRMWTEYRALWSKYAADEFMQKAFGQGVTGNDAKWIPTILSSQLMRFLEVNGAIIPLFRSFPLASPTADFPITTSIGQAILESRLAAANTAITISGDPLYSTSPISKITFTSIKLRAHVEVDSDFIEDSIVPMIPFMEQDMGDAIRRAIEDAIINGDDTSSGLDADNTSSTHARRAWNGLRTVAVDNSTTVAQGTTADMAALDIFNMKTLLGKYGLLASDVALICGVRSYHEMLAITTIETVQNFGARATLLTGGLTQITGSNVVVSQYVREDLSATGEQNSTTEDNTIVIAVHKPSWWLGNWRGITLERQRNPGDDSDVVYARWRGDFQKIRPSTETTEAVLVNVNAT